jgi:hypothetical protein
MLSAAAIAIVAGCSDEPDVERTVRSPPKQPPALHEQGRLEVTEGPSPAQWLASRQTGRDLTKDDPLVRAYGGMLKSAGRRFREYPRMIANRAVQLEEMLAEKGIPETAPQIIEGLAGVSGDTRYVESFGALCQQYYNLRMQGLQRHAALKVLKSGGDATN